MLPAICTTVFAFLSAGLLQCLLGIQTGVSDEQARTAEGSLWRTTGLECAPSRRGDRRAGSLADLKFRDSLGAILVGQFRRTASI